MGQWLRASVSVRPGGAGSYVGDIVGITSRSESAEPVGLWTAAGWLPPDVQVDAGADVLPGDRFAGRTAELADLSDKIREARTVAVVGEPGAGKSTLVRQWVARNSADFTFVWWIDAADEAAVDAGLIRLAHVLSRNTLVGLDLARLRDLALQWLRTHPGWLMVLDAVGHPIQIQGLLSQLPDGAFLITADSGGIADSDWPAAWTEVAPGPLGEPDPTTPSGEATGAGDLDPSGARQLLDEAFAKAGTLAHDPAQLYRLLPQLETWLALPPSELPSPVAGRLALAAGAGLAAVADFGRAAGYLWRAVQELEQYLGAAHGETLRARNTLGCALLGLGGCGGAAISVFEENLARCRQAQPGSEDEVLTAAHNLACALIQFGYGVRELTSGDKTLQEKALEYRPKAIELAEECLSRAKERFGAEHPATWEAQDVLATALGFDYHPGPPPQDRVRRAEELFDQTWAGRASASGARSVQALYSKLRVSSAIAQQPRRRAEAEAIVRSVYEDFVSVGGEQCEGALLAQEFLFADAHACDFDEESATIGRAWLENVRAVYGVRHDMTIGAYYDAIYEASMAGLPQVERELRDQLRADFRLAAGVDLGGWVIAEVCDVAYLAAGDIAGAARRHARQLRAQAPVGVDPTHASAESTSTLLEREFPQLDLNAWIWRRLESSIEHVTRPLPSQHPQVETRVIEQAARNLALAREHMLSLRLTL